MKKAITIPKIEEQLYNRVKEKAEETNQSVSDYVSFLFSHANDIYSNKESLDELKEEIEAKNITISEQANKIKDLENKVESNENFEKENNQLKSNLALTTQKFESSQKELEATKQELKVTEEENEQFLKIDPNKITVEFNDLERSLIYFICERESKRVGKEINPGQLLKAMFVNYSIKGDSYFFKHPTRSEILKLKEKLNTENNE